MACLARQVCVDLSIDALQCYRYSQNLRLQMGAKRISGAGWRQSPSPDTRARTLAAELNFTREGGAVLAVV